MRGGETVFFLPSLNGGGAERSVLNLLGQVGPPEAFHRPLLVVRTLQGQLRDQVPAGLEVVELGGEAKGLWASAGSVPRLAKFLRQRRPGVVVSVLSLPAVALALAISGCRSKLVANVQNPILLNNGAVNGVFRLSARAVDRFWVIAPGIGRQLTDHLRIPEQKVEVLPNSVDVDRVRLRAGEEVCHPAFVDGGKPVLLTAGRLVPQKRMDLVLRAAAGLSKRHDFMLAILGEGPLQAALEVLAGELGIAERTVFLGFQQNPWKFMSKASVFVLASDYEGFGNVILEAMACRIPVVCTKAPFGPEYILTHGDNGLLVDCGDVESIGRSVGRLLTEPSLRERCVAGGERRSLDFDVKQVGRRFRTLLQDVAAE